MVYADAAEGALSGTGAELREATIAVNQDALGTLAHAIAAASARGQEIRLFQGPRRAHRSASALATTQQIPASWIESVGTHGIRLPEAH